MFSFRLDFTVITFKISCWQRKIWHSQKHLKRHNPRSWQIRRSSTKSEFLLERFDKQNKPFFQSQVSRLGLRCLFSLLLKNITHRNPGVKQLNVIDSRRRALSPICVLRIVNLTPRGMLRMSHSQMPLEARWISVCTSLREKGKAGLDIKLRYYWRVRKSVWKLTQVLQCLLFLRENTKTF